MMKWCCYIFEDLVACAGEPGISVIVGILGKASSFILQARAVEVGTRVPNIPIKIVTLTEQAIFHCPGCGVRLDKYYKKSIEQLRREDLVNR